VAALAARQHGVVSHWQLVDLGLTNRAVQGRVRAEHLHGLHRGVYAVGHPGLTPRGRELAAVFARGPAALLSHRSAARLWELLRSASARIEVTAPRTREPRSGLTVHTSRVLAAEDRCVIDAIPVTSLARTIVDLAEVLTDPRLARAVHEAEVRKLFDLAAVERALERVPGRRGRPRLLRVLAAYRPEDHELASKAERRFGAICREHGPPQPRRIQIAGYEADFYWPEARLAARSTARRSTTRAAPSTPIARATARWPRSASRCCA
jgi:hypothetical protein